MSHDELTSMFSSLIISGLISTRDLVEGGFCEVAAQVMTAAECPQVCERDKKMWRSRNVAESGLSRQRRRVEHTTTTSMMAFPSVLASDFSNDDVSAARRISAALCNDMSLEELVCDDVGYM